MGLWKSLGRRYQIGILSIAACLAVVAASGGCYAHRRPAALSADEQKLLDAQPLPYTVSIVPWNADAAETTGRDPQAYAKSLATVVQRSGAFRATRYDDRPAANADLVAISTGAHCDTSIIPVFTILTVGVIPTIFDAEECEGMILRAAKPSTTPPVEIAVSHKSEVITGWAAVVFGAMPGWSWRRGADDRRYNDRFRIEIIRHQADIDRMVHSAPPAPPAAAATPSPAAGSAPPPSP
jgi:hypothetical protein